MIRNFVAHLLCWLLGLSLAACGTFEVSRQDELAAGQVEAAENTAMVTKEKEAPATAISTPETPLPETEVAVSTVHTETVGVEAVVAEVETVFEDDTVYANKTLETLFLPGCYDFDSGERATPAGTACDFSMLPGPDSGTIEIYPHAGAQLAYGGVFLEAPTLAQCAASSAFSGDREVVAPMAAMYVCYRTGEGRTGYLHFTAADLEQAGALTLDWLTYAGEDGAGAEVGREDLTYRNTVFGFELTLPPTWNGFETAQNAHANGSNICFTFVGSAPFCVLQIDVWRKVAWNNLETVPDGYYLGESEWFVFAAGPYQAECVQLDAFQCERHLEIPAILAEFRME